MLAIEASKNTQPIDRPINGELPACLAEAGSSKKKRTNNRGKGGLDRVERLRNTERNQKTLSGVEGGEKKKGRDEREMRNGGLITYKSMGWCVESHQGLS